MTQDNTRTVDSPGLNNENATATRHGVFYPSGYAVAAFENASIAGHVLDKINQASNSIDDRLMTPDQMLELMDESVKSASVLAKIVSAELKQVEILRQFAQDGHSFVIFNRAQLSEEAFASIVIGAAPAYLIHYGMLAIENLNTGRDKTPQASPLGMNERGRDN